MRLSLRYWALTACVTYSCHGSIPVLASTTVSSPSPPPSPGSETAIPPPFVSGKVLVNGTLQEVKSDMAELGNGMGSMKLSEVYGCCTWRAVEDCPDEDTNERNERKEGRVLSRPVIGAMPQFTKEQSLQALEAATKAWDGGSGTWPQMPLAKRIAAVEAFLVELGSKREDIVDVLMWEIGKNRPDAEAEFDRTVKFVRQTIALIRHGGGGDFGSEWDASNGATRLFSRRAAIGIVLCLGPYNYPLNETYATLIPALLMGNVALLKVPTVGGLAHLLTMEAFSKTLPPGTIQLVSGSGRTTMPPLMESGKINSLAFIGGSRAADNLIRAHPEPHRLKLFLQLEAKNMGIYMPDLFRPTSTTTTNWDRILGETITGSLSYNGQRCTALKILFVPKDHADTFATMLSDRVESLSVGLPWESTTDSNGATKFSQITPLPNENRIKYMQDLIADAVDKGARIMNKNGGQIVSGGSASESTLMVPAVLYPITPDMKLWDEEQFGPVVPIAPYDTLDDVLAYAREGKYGQQASIFTSSTDEADVSSSAALLDRFSTVFGKININSQCGRSPDTAPFSGRRSSAMGVMSVADALREFSVPTVISYKDAMDTGAVVEGMEKYSNFLQSIS